MFRGVRRIEKPRNVGEWFGIILGIARDKRVVEAVSNQSFLPLPPRNVTAVYDYARHG